MILETINSAILARIKADTGAGGLYANNAWNIISGAYGVFATPNPAPMPYLVWNTELQQTHTATGDEFLVTVNMTCYSDVNVYDEVTNFSTNVSAVMDRLHGDAVLQAGRIPTYGFNRHLLVLPTNGYTAKASNCLVKSYLPAVIDERVVGCTMTMEFRVSAIAANP